LKLQLGSVPAYRRIADEQYRQFTGVTLPLPSARLHLAADDPLRPIIEAVMREEDLELSQMKIKHLREPFFSKGDRAAIFTPTETDVQSAEDERHEDSQKVILKFTLPRGCYATLLIKRVMAR
jgi:tRNA pseudouridine13 synthase